MNTVGAAKHTGGTVKSNTNGHIICCSTFLSHVTVVAVFLIFLVLTPGATSVTRITSTSDSTVSVNASNSTSLFAPNDPYRWKEQLIIKQEQAKHSRRLDVEYRSVLVVRIVTDGDSDGNIIENEINNVLFYESTQITVQRQMKLCSGGRIIFQPSNDGIITVRMNNLGTSRVEPYTMAVSEKVMKEYYRSTDTLVGYKEQLRKMADHVLIILPESFPANTFVANAEIGRPICVFSYQWLSSISAYMHEMGHNINLRHSGKGSSEPYGDNTGYMGVSNPKAYGPQKCYNAAQHWSLNFYDIHRVSLLDIGLSSTPVLLQVAAFVDHEKIGSDFTVLVQVSSNTYLQFNRAKSYNVGTEMMIDQVVVINDAGDKTILIAGLDANSNVLSLSSVAIQVCSINIGDASGIDYAVVAVATSNNGRMCDGALLSSASSVISTLSPTNPPITSGPTNSPTTYGPTNSPITDEPTSPPVFTTAVPQPSPTFLPTELPTTYKPTNPNDVDATFPPTSSPTEYYVSSPHPTDQEEKEYLNKQNLVDSQTPIFITSSVDNDESGNEVVRSSFKASSATSSGTSPAFVPGILVLVGVMIVTALVTLRRMAIHRHYLSKPLRTRDDDLDKDDQKSGSISTFMEDVEVSTNGFISNINNLLFDYEIDLGDDDNNATSKKNRR